MVAMIYSVICYLLHFSSTFQTNCYMNGPCCFVLDLDQIWNKFHTTMTMHVIFLTLGMKTIILKTNHVDHLFNLLLKQCYSCFLGRFFLIITFRKTNSKYTIKVSKISPTLTSSLQYFTSTSKLIWIECTRISHIDSKASTLGR